MSVHGIREPVPTRELIRIPSGLSTKPGRLSSKSARQRIAMPTPPTERMRPATNTGSGVVRHSDITHIATSSPISRPKLIYEAAAGLEIGISQQSIDWSTSPPDHPRYAVSSHSNRMVRLYVSVGRYRGGFRRFNCESKSCSPFQVAKRNASRFEHLRLDELQVKCFL